MSAPTSPADLHRHGLRLLLDKDIAAWVALWAEDGLMEFPFAPRDGRSAWRAGMPSPRT
ncbi:nuclear transport factor 2 family protein [Nocardiopsis sp. ARC36]